MCSSVDTDLATIPQQPYMAKQNQRPHRKKKPRTCLAVGAWCAFLFMVPVKHSIHQCFLLIILFFKNH